MPREDIYRLRSLTSEWVAVTNNYYVNSETNLMPAPEVKRDLARLQPLLELCSQLGKSLKRYEQIDHNWTSRDANSTAWRNFWTLDKHVKKAVDSLSLGVPIQANAFVSEAKCQTPAELYALMGFGPTPKPLYTRFKISREWEFSKHVSPCTWSLGMERELFRLQCALDTTPEESPNRGEYENNVRTYRKARRESQVVGATYTLQRGPIEFATTGESAYDFAALKRCYFAARRKASHLRKMARRPMHLRQSSFGIQVARTYLQSGQVILRQKQARLQELKEDKAPVRLTGHVGVELEFASPAKSAALLEALSDAGLKDYVCLKTDGSLRVSKLGDSTHELCVLATEKEIRTVLSKVCKVLKGKGSYVNASCGLHVHLDMRRRRVEDCYGRLVRALPVLSAMVPGERRFNKFCRLNPLTSTWGRLGLRDDDGHGRYWAINPSAYSKHKTLEVRLHTGSLNATKIQHWVDLLLLVISTKTTDVFKTAPALIKGLKLPEGLASYVLSRVETFNTHGAEEPESLPIREDSTPPADDFSPVCSCGECTPPALAQVGRDEDEDFDFDSSDDDIAA